MKSLILINKDKACDLLTEIGQDILECAGVMGCTKMERSITNLADLAYEIGGLAMSKKVEDNLWGSLGGEEEKNEEPKEVVEEENE